MRWIWRFLGPSLAALVLATLSGSDAIGQEQFQLIPEARFLLGMEWGHWWLSGEMLIPAGGRPGSGGKLDLASDLGVDQGDASAVSLFGTILENHLINIDYLGISPSGVRKCPRTLIFHNQTYAEGTNVETRIDLSWFHAAYGYKAWKDPSWWIAPKIGVHYIQYSATLNGRTKGEELTSNNRTLDGTFPVLGLEARYLLPYGIDVSAEVDGVHLITRGYLSTLRIGASWEVHPDVVLSIACSSRLASYLEDNQPLNNEWWVSLSGVSTGIAVGF